MTGNMWWMGPTVIVFCRLLVLEARLTRSERSGSALVFRIPIAGRLIWAFSLLSLSVLLVKDLGKDELWVTTIGIVLVVFLSLGWPSTITVDSSGVTRHLWWKPKRHVSWNQVVCLEKNRGGDLKLYGADGKTIDFTRFHSAPQRFESEVLKRAKLKGTTDASAPNMLPHL
jgi:hypothetical protein